MGRFLWWLSDRLPVRVIERLDSQRYLERYYLGKIWRWTFFLHRFVHSDPDDEVHDHPWNSISLILVGKYLETRWLGGDLIKRERRWFNWIRGETFHHLALFEDDTKIGVMLDKPVWTLFIHGRRFKNWGFMRLLSLESGKEKMSFYSYSPVPRGTYSEKGWHKKASKGRDIRTANA